DNFKKWALTGREKVGPNQTYQPNSAPFEGQSTTASHFVPHPMDVRRSFKPSQDAARTEGPFDGTTLYRMEYVPKHIEPCPAALLDTETSRYLYKETDDTGHKFYQARNGRSASAANLNSRRLVSAMQVLLYVISSLFLLGSLASSCSNEQPAKQRMRFKLVSLCPAASGGPRAEKLGSEFGCAMLCTLARSCNAFHFARPVKGDPLCYLGDACAPGGGAAQWTAGHCKTFSYQDTSNVNPGDTPGLLAEQKMKLFYRFKKSGPVNEANPRLHCLTAQNVTIGSDGAQFEGNQDSFLKTEIPDFGQYLNYGGIYTLYAVLRKPIRCQFEDSAAQVIFYSCQSRRICLFFGWLIEPDNLYAITLKSQEVGSAIGDQPFPVSIGVSFNQSAISTFYFNGSALAVSNYSLGSSLLIRPDQGYRHLRFSSSDVFGDTGGSIRCFGFTKIMHLLWHVINWLLLVKVNSKSTEQAFHNLRFELQSLCPAAIGGPRAEKLGSEFGCAMLCVMARSCNAFHFARPVKGDPLCYLGDACATDGGAAQWTTGHCKTFSFKSTADPGNQYGSSALFAELRMQLFYKFKKSGLVNEANPRLNCLKSHNVTMGIDGAKFKGTQSSYLSVKTPGFEQYLNYGGVFSLYAVLRAPFNSMSRTYCSFTNKTLGGYGGILVNCQKQAVCLATSSVASRTFTGWVSKTTTAATSHHPVEMSVGVSFNRTSVAAFYFNGSVLELGSAFVTTMSSMSLDQFSYMRLSTSLEGDGVEGSISCTMKASELLCELLNAAEKSAELARAIRREESLFHLLIEEKTGDDKGKRFGFDFKTLADVLVQEMVRHDLEKKFPGLGKRVLGEENNKFTNTVGDTVTVEIKENRKKTHSVLTKILDGNDRAATVLTGLVHEEVTVPRPAQADQLDSVQLDKKSIGLWIDPIDGTAEYISGGRDPEFRPGETVSQNGLPNVTVLIGVFDKATGLPIMGVINQPFFRTMDGKA
uniref:inositol-1,4-bisphosphate 1-phosphatase n=1 Tax=Macrostomum lignano TaxID=282301 RepID=A0A1I8JIC5_9PLAT